MEKQEIYLLYMGGINPLNRYHHRFVIFQAYNSFRQAFLKLQQFNDRYFDPTAARRFKLPLQISFAGIRTAGDARYLLEKKMIPTGNEWQLPPGLYITLPHPELNMHLFDLYTENYLVHLPRFVNSIQVSTPAQLQKKDRHPRLADKSVWFQTPFHRR